MDLPSGIWKNITDRAEAIGRGPIARASMVSVGIRAGGLGLSFLQAILTARLLGPAGYGTVAAILSAAQVLAIVAMFGLGGLAVREIPAKISGPSEGQLAHFLKCSAVVVCLFSAFLSAIAAMVVLPTLPVEGLGSGILVIGALLIIPLANLGLVRGWAQGLGLTASAQIPSEVVRPTIMVAFLFAALAFGLPFDVAAYLFGALGTAVLAALAAIWVLWRKRLRTLDRPQQGEKTSAMMLRSAPFLALGLAAALQGEINTIMLAMLAGPTETGLFQPVSRLSVLLTLPVQAASMRYAPRIVELWRQNETARIQAITRTYTWTTSTLTLGLLIVVAGLGPWLMLAFGEEFEGSAPLLWIVGAAYLVNAAGGPLGALFTMANRTGLAVFGQLFGLAINVAIGMAFIPEYGALASAWGIFAATIAWNVILVAIARRQLGLDPSLVGFIFAPRKTPDA